ncbi:type II secretion system protein M [Aquipseudomonas campi]
MRLLKSLQASLEATGLAAYWRGLAPRDQLALGLLSLFLLLVLLYLLLWRPAAQQVQQARAYLEQQRELHLYLQANTAQAREAQSKPQAANIEPARLQGFITASAGSQGLTVERLDSQGDGAVQVSLQPAEFARLLRWLIELQGQGVRVDEAGLERADKGLVSSRLLLRSGT